MNAMDDLFDLYNQYFDRLAGDIRRTNQKNGAANPDDILIRRRTRSEFEAYLSNGRETESKRLFLKRILRGRADVSAALPNPLKLLVERAA